MWLQFSKLYRPKNAHNFMGDGHNLFHCAVLYCQVLCRFLFILLPSCQNDSRIMEWYYLNTKMEDERVNKNLISECITMSGLKKLKHE